MADIDTGIDPGQVNPIQITDAAKLKYLDSLGHLQGFSAQQVIDLVASFKSGNPTSTAAKALVEATESFQRFHSLPVTGDFAGREERLMLSPRCQVPDIVKLPPGVAAATTSQKWGIVDINFSHNINFVMGGMPAADVDKALRLACEAWNKVCGIRIKVVPYSGDKGTHIWARGIKIDGSGGTLAWSYLASNNLGNNGRLEQRYDSGEPWKTRGMLYLSGTACHEIGHALGMDHSNSQKDLMYPYMREGLYIPQTGDIARVVDRYGKPATPVPPTDPTDPSPDPGDKVTVSSVAVNLSDGRQQLFNASIVLAPDSNDDFRPV